MLVKKGYQRIILLQILYYFKVDLRDLVNINILNIRSILEQSCVVWNYSITEEESTDLERVQRLAIKISLQDDYISCEQALEDLNLETLSERRSSLCLQFAKRSVKHDKAKELLPLN